MSPETEHLVERGRKLMKQMEELQKESQRLSGEFRKTVRKLETLEPDDPPVSILFSRPTVIGKRH